MGNAHIFFFKNICLKMIKPSLQHVVFSLSFSCLLWPCHLTYQDVKSLKTGTKVKVKRNTPPMIALIDENILPSFETYQEKNTLAMPSLKTLPEKIVSHTIKKPLMIKVSSQNGIQTFTYQKTFVDQSHTTSSQQRQNL